MKTYYLIALLRNRKISEYVCLLGECSPWRLWACDPMNRVYEGVHQGICGHVTPGKGSDVGHERGDCGHITPCAGGKEVTLETVGV